MIAPHVTTPPVAGSYVQSQPHEVPTHWSSRHCHMPAVPHQWQLHQHQYRLRVLSFEGLPSHHQPEPRRGQLPAILSALPHHDTVAGATFDHNTTKFPLTGKHATTTCAQCHSSGQYATSEHGLLGCHLKDYQTTNNPNHVAAGFPQDCQLCHTTTQWLGAKFDHNATKFPLTGAHVTVTCAQCHTTEQYARLSTNVCRAIWRITRAPTTRTTSQPASRRIASYATPPRNGSAPSSITTRLSFPLTGAHSTVTCQ